MAVQKAGMKAFRLVDQKVAWKAEKKAGKMVAWKVDKLERSKAVQMAAY